MLILRETTERFEGALERVYEKLWELGESTADASDCDEFTN